MEDNKIESQEFEKKKSSLGQFDYSEEDSLKMEANVFGDGSRIIPRIQIQYAKKYMLWGDNGNRNDYPNKLLELYNNSSLHHYIIDLKTILTIGDGLILKDTGSTNAIKTQKFLDAINSDDDNVNDILAKQAQDLWIYGGHTEEIIMPKNYGEISEVKYLEMYKVRPERPNNYGKINGYFWAFSWTDNNRPTRPIYCPAFSFNKAGYNKQRNAEIMQSIQDNQASPEDVEQLKNFITDGSMINYYKIFRSNSYFFPLPDYVAVIPAIEIDIESDIYALSSLKNGMDSGVKITMFGDPDDPELRKGIKIMLKNYSGARKAGKPWIVTALNQDVAPKLDDIGNSNSLAQKYKVINDSQQQKILSGHGINNPAMLGIFVAGKLGNSQGLDIAQSYETFYNFTIKPKQKILEKFWNDVMKFNGLDEVQIKSNNIFNQNTVETQQNQSTIDAATKDNNITT